jgi:hypothetical protein
LDGVLLRDDEAGSVAPVAAALAAASRFRHHAAQAAARRRHQLHARIAATLEERLPDLVAAQPALLARIIARKQA